MTETGKPIQFRSSKLIAPGVPAYRRQNAILGKLHEWEAIKLYDDNLFEVYSSSSSSAFLEILLLKFDEIEREYKKKAEISKYPETTNFRPFTLLLKAVQATNRSKVIEMVRIPTKTLELVGKVDKSRQSVIV